MWEYILDHTVRLGGFQGRRLKMRYSTGSRASIEDALAFIAECIDTDNGILATRTGRAGAWHTYAALKARLAQILAA